MLQKEIYDYGYLMRALERGTACEDVKIDTLGHSILGREIPLLTVGNGNRGVLYVGAHGGTEGLTCAVLLEFIFDILGKCKSDAQVYERKLRTLLEERRIFVIPMLNPDGVEYALHGLGDSNPLRERVERMSGGEGLAAWQANARGVDLHHNYDAGFLAYKRRETGMGVAGGAPSGYSGEYPESEPETAALCRFLRYRREEIDGVLTLRLGEEEITCSCRDSLSAKTLSAGRVLQRVTGYRLVHPEENPPLGGLTDWCIEGLKRPAYTVRCKDAGNASATPHAVIFERLRRALYTFPYMI